MTDETMTLNDDEAAESFLAQAMPVTHATFVENGRVSP